MPALEAELGGPHAALGAAVLQAVQEDGSEYLVPDREERDWEVILTFCHITFLEDGCDQRFVPRLRNLAIPPALVAQKHRPTARLCLSNANGLPEIRRDVVLASRSPRLEFGGSSHDLVLCDILTRHRQGGSQTVREIGHGGWPNRPLDTAEVFCQRVGASV